jgi:uncharacterized protein with PIN domain
VLHDLSEQVAHCYRRAAECRERADTSADLADKAFYGDRESAWLTLARSFELSERIGRVLSEKQRQRARNWPAAGLTSALNVLPSNCLACNVEMLLQLAEPMFVQGVMTFERAYVVCPNCARIGTYRCD